MLLFLFNSLYTLLGEAMVPSGIKSSEPCGVTFPYHLSASPISQTGEDMQVHSMGVDDTGEGGAVFHI